MDDFEDFEDDLEREEYEDDFEDGEDYEDSDMFEGDYEEFEGLDSEDDGEGDLEDLYDGGDLEEMEELMGSAIAARSSNEQDAFLGALASIASKVLPSALRIGKRLLPKLVRTGRKFI
ncbi:MAG: hypothetical protein WBN43_09995, partial [Thiogranum sp.]